MITPISSRVCDALDNVIFQSMPWQLVATLNLDLSRGGRAGLIRSDGRHGTRGNRTRPAGRRRSSAPGSRCPRPARRGRLLHRGSPSEPLALARRRTRRTDAVERSSATARSAIVPTRRISLRSSVSSSCPASASWPHHWRSRARLGAPYSSSNPGRSRDRCRWRLTPGAWSGRGSDDPFGIIVVLIPCQGWRRGGGRGIRGGGPGGWPRAGPGCAAVFRCPRWSGGRTGR